MRFIENALCYSTQSALLYISDTPIACPRLILMFGQKFITKGRYCEYENHSVHVHRVIRVTSLNVLPRLHNMP